MLGFFKPAASKTSITFSAVMASEIICLTYRGCYWDCNVCRSSPESVKSLLPRLATFFARPVSAVDDMAICFLAVDDDFFIYHALLGF